MDSGNSGSLQSSSGGDEEYDSLIPSSAAACATISTTTTTTHHHHPHPPPPSSLYDTLSYYDSFPRSPPNPFLHLETPWSRTPSATDITGLLPTSTSTTTNTTNPFSLTTPSKPSPTPPEPPPPPPRNSKKRSRASRRAPTTVLTTDTSNFRAMVQEFTGIPTSPFATPSSSSSFPRSRLDIFSGRSSFNDSLLSPPPYLLRPFPQKLQPSSSFPPLSSSSSSSSSSLSVTASTLNATTIARPSSCTTNPNPTNNFQLPHDHHHHHHLGLTMQNQMFTFQSLLQPPINSLSNIPAFTDKSRSNDHHHHQAIPDLGVANLDHGDVNNLTGNLSSLVGSAEGGDCKINF
ncbi:VQ domain-containing protein [Dioscorea alata]|uniref:VQ domain-containing protein n=1 Tax=Dioscorea alata TaxID=55571 RepID=A0ACB7TXG5_DIOAL|nr:VQ domain-containing protein [Dioscorea alata]